jgi:glycosyltransferase involved in cell wall biosynthesis
MQSKEIKASSIRLEKPMRITEQVWPEGTMPLVSIWCITYNHENFIRDAIEGFLMQETTFPVEIFIHDDASTDSTAEIIKEYADQYPKLFWTVLQNENQWSKGNRRILFDYHAKQRGEFIALCEGDDYWTAKDKLQNQVEILLKDPSISLVFHNAYCKHVNSQDDFLHHNRLNKNRYTLNDIIEHGWLMTTASMVHRKINTFPLALYNYVTAGDKLIQICACLSGDAFYYDRVCSVYRFHEHGVSAQWNNQKIDHEKVVPNMFWMYWILRCKFLPESAYISTDMVMRSYIWRIAKYVIKNEKMPLVFFAGHLRNGVNKIINNCMPIFFIDENGDYDKVNFFILKSCASYVRQIPKQLLLEMIRPIIKLYA